jgi:hypothetical protein
MVGLACEEALQGKCNCDVVGQPICAASNLSKVVLTLGVNDLNC